MIKAPRVPRKLPKSRPTKIVLITAVVLIAYAVVVWYFSRWLEPGGLGLWILRGSLWLLGILAAALALWYLLRAQAGQAAPDEIDAAVEAAEARLATSRLPSKERRSQHRALRYFTERPTLSRMPLVLILGPEGSSKTTAVVRAGLGPELLVGELFRGDLVAPTDAVNLWYTRGTVILEAGGPVVADDSRWRSLVHHVRQERLAPLFLGQPPAPRVAVVCFSCEEFVKPGSTSAVPAAARDLRERLVQVSQSLGIQLPVYVLFTKTDLIPYFEDYVQNFSHEEASEVLGATLRLPPAAAPASHADWEYRRLSDTFERLYQSLAARRLEVLYRETEPEGKCNAYEFPREFAKIKDLAVRFMVELCKPSQLDVSPFLRGFYFAGVRPVIVADPAFRDTPQMGTAAELDRIGATQVFDPRRHQPSEAQRPAPVSRKVPQWLFLERLFRDVILRDRIAMGITQLGVRTSIRRRWLLGSAVALSLLLGSCFSISYVGNRRLETRATRASVALAELGSYGRGDAAYLDAQGMPTDSALDRLENLRRQVATLVRYEHGRTPLRLRWGLYTGSSLYLVSRQIYLDWFGKLLLEPSRALLLDSLRSADEARNYKDSFDALRAYLMTTTQTARIDSAFLAPYLTARWLNNRRVDPEYEQLANRQFEFYSGQLCHGEDTPCAAEANETIVRRTCTFLEQSAGVEGRYALLLSLANRSGRPVRFSDPGAIVENSYQVPAAFTKAGWEDVNTDLESLEFEVVDWVCPAQTVSESNLASLRQHLRARYVADYVRHWRGFLEGTSVRGFRTVEDALRSLQLLDFDGNYPLLKALSTVAQNTAVDSQVASVFQPVHTVTPPDSTDPLVVESNQPYVFALRDLKAAVQQLNAATTGMQDEALRETRAAAADADNAVRQLADRFLTQGEAGVVGETVRQLLSLPIGHTEDLIRAEPARNLGAVLRSFCNEVQPITDKYPFHRGAGEAVATLEDLTFIFEPGTGALWRFYDRDGRAYLEQRGSHYVVRHDVTPRPSDGFARFFDEAAAVTRALWPNGATEPRLRFAVRPQPTQIAPVIEINIDGTRAISNLNAVRTTTIEWVGSSAGFARLAVHVDGTVHEREFSGTWALFRLFQLASWRSISEGEAATWEIPIRVQAVLVGAPALLKQGTFLSTRCDPRVVQ